MELSRISALLAPFLDPGMPLSSIQIGQISTYIDLLLRWNARINLTAVRDPESIVTRHFGESLFLARHLFPAPANVGPASLSSSGPASIRDVGRAAQASSPLAVDIGSGAGFPGLPLKIWTPHIALTMIESNHKKAAFLREVSRALTLTGVNVISERAESLVGAIAPADLITFRAVERFESTLQIATRLLAPGGRLALLIGESQLPTLTVAAPGTSWSPPIHVPGSASRVVSISLPGT